MSEKTCKKIRLIYGIFLSVILIVTGALLILSCVSIYRLGDRPFTEKNISEAFDRIKAAVFVSLGALAGGILLNLCLPREPERKLGKISKKIILSRLEKKADPTLMDSDSAKRIKDLKNLRLAFVALVAAISVSLAIPTALKVLNFSNYSSHSYNASVKEMCLWIIPCFLIIAGLAIAFLIIEDLLVNRQIALYKQAIASGAVKSSGNPEEKSISEKFVSALILCARIIIPVIAVFLIIEGITHGGASDILRKAINICTECIGLG